MEAEPPAQGAGVRRELNGGPATCCPQRTEGLPRGGKDVHRFGAQKRSESSQTTHRSFVWAVPLRGTFPGNGTGFLQRVPRLGGGGRSPTSSPCESAASATTGPPPGFAEPGESHLRTSSACRRYRRKFGPPRDAARLRKKSSSVIISSALKGIRTLNGLHERPL